MRYQQIEKGIFLERPNRFIAHVLIDGRQVVCHVKNTGRCKELLLPGVSVIVEFHPDAQALGRKTAYSLIGVYKAVKDGEILVNMDSQAPNQAAYEWLCSLPDVSSVKREVRFGESRFDLAFVRDGKPAFMEVKGVTLELDGVARFPDAPTLRGIKHLKELGRAVKEGYLAYVLFVIQMTGMHEFQPNEATHPEFGETLREVRECGVEVLAYDCQVAPDSLAICRPVPVNLLGCGTPIGDSHIINIRNSVM